jgi:hypothetical protein
VMDSIALWLGMHPPAIMFNQMDMSRFIHCVGCSSVSPIHSLNKPQRRVVKQQWTKRWSTVLVHYLQRGHNPQFGHPRLAKRSAFHILSWLASQLKNFAFGGAQAFQIVLSMSEEVEPKNCNSYAEFPEYCPLGVTLQPI